MVLMLVVVIVHGIDSYDYKELIKVWSQ